MNHKSIIVVVSAAVAIFGCSSSSSGTTSTGGGGGNSNVCPKIAQADIQALLANPITSVNETDLDSALLECDANGLQIQMNTDDSDKELYLTAYGDGGGDTTAVSGVGDTAYWWGVNCGTGTCQSIPTFAAHKGSATCYISSDNDPTNYSMAYTQDPPPFGIKTSDAAAWAAKAGKVCTDFFAAAGV